MAWHMYGRHIDSIMVNSYLRHFSFHIEHCEMCKVGKYSEEVRVTVRSESELKFRTNDQPCVSILTSIYLDSERSEKVRKMLA